MDQRCSICKGKLELPTYTLSDIGIDSAQGKADGRICSKCYSSIDHIAHRDKYPKEGRMYYREDKNYKQDQAWLASHLKGGPVFPRELDDYLTGILAQIPDYSRVYDYSSIIARRDRATHTIALVTSGYNFEGYRITEYLGPISGDVVLGTGFLSEFKSGFSDFFGVESESFANKMENAKSAALEKLQNKAYTMRADALIGLDFDYITFAGNMIGISANATAVTIEKLPDTKEVQSED